MVAPEVVRQTPAVTPSQKALRRAWVRAGGIGREPMLQFCARWKNALALRRTVCYTVDMMNKPDIHLEDDDVRPEYGPDVFALGVRGKHFANYQAGTNLALLAPDVRSAFPTDEAVNGALRLLVKLAHQRVSKVVNE